MDARNLRLIKLFTKHIGLALLWMVAAVAYLAILEIVGQPYSIILSAATVIAGVAWFSWDLAKSRLEYMEYKEKKLENQLVNSD